MLTTSYHDFFTWRRNDLKGITVNIDNGIRRTFNGNKQKGKGKEFWFFGGSPTWGTGVSDEYTIPSMFSQLTGYFTINFGETGYIANQSAKYLSNYLIQNKVTGMTDINVVFYDGANDVVMRCEVSGLSTTRRANKVNI